MKDNSSRLADHITKLFDDFYKKAGPTNLQQGRALADLRQLIHLSISVFLGEASIAKQYGVPVDALSLVSFDAAKWPPSWAGVDFRNSWIPIPTEGEQVRPAGITNEEYSDCQTKLLAEFKDFLEKEQKQRIQQPKVISNENYQSLLHAVVMLFRDAFLKPATDVPFRAGTYVRITVGVPTPFPLVLKEDISKQNVPCHICGENRVINNCHILPARIGGSATIDNLLFFCPTHHSLFDRGMLSRDEWDRIDWSVKNKKSQIYALRVLKPVHEKFWQRVEAGVFEKKHQGAPKGEIGALYAQCKDEIENNGET